MPLALGTRLGPYEICAPIGAGGMGEVYRARDTRLNRDVALKVLPDHLAHDPLRRQRFEQEARSVAALNHPNIVAVYDVGENYFVTELVEGESLRSMGSVPARAAIDLAVQIADGLAAAHARGITHRDLKPENIMVTRDGRAKILDFGLAKVTQTAIGADSATQTQEGIVLGTAGYMSPEQVRGQAADPRSDIFSLGLVLYEMLAGKSAYTGESSIEVMHSILKEDPAELPGSVSPGLRLIIEHCLEKLPDRRFQSARDLAFALQSLAGSGPALAISVPAAAPRMSGKKLWAAIGGLALVSALGAAFWAGRSVSTRPIPEVRHPTADRGLVTGPSASPGVAAPKSPEAPRSRATTSVAPSKPPLASQKQIATAAKIPPDRVEARVASARTESTTPTPAPSESPSGPVSPDADAAYNEGIRLLDDDKATESVRRFDDAIRANPDYLEAYVGRASARRRLRQYELSLADCDKIVQINSTDARGYNCRGFDYLLLQQYEPAVRDLNAAIRLNPNFAMAFEHRADAYSALQQYEKAIQDYTQVIHLQPRNAECHIRRAIAYTNLKQYDNAVRDYTEAIRFQPNSIRAYNGRAAVEELLGDTAGAAADRRHARESRKK